MPVAVLSFKIAGEGFQIRSRYAKSLVGYNSIAGHSGDILRAAEGSKLLNYLGNCHYSGLLLSTVLVCFERKE